MIKPQFFYIVKESRLYFSAGKGNPQKNLIWEREYPIEHFIPSCYVFLMLWLLHYLSRIVYLYMPLTPTVFIVRCLPTFLCFQDGYYGSDDDNISIGSSFSGFSVGFSFSSSSQLASLSPVFLRYDK